MPVSELMDFTGGLSTSIAPHLIPINESTLVIDTQLRSGSLVSDKLPLPLAVLSGRYFYHYNGVNHSYTNLRSSVLWDQKWYWADGTNTMKMLPSGVETYLGLEAPSGMLTIGSAGAGIQTGTYQYTYTFYDNVTGTESAPANLSNSLAVTNQNITMTGFDNTPPPAATHIRLYKVGGYLSQFTMVDTIALNTVTYIDSLDLSKIDGRLLQTLHTGLPPTGIQFLTELNGRLYGAVGNRVYFSALGNPDSWYIDDFYVVTNTITGIGSTSAGLIIFTQFSTNILRGIGPENFFIKELSAIVGCTSHYSIAQYQGSIIWLSADSFNISDGYTIKDLTSNKIKNISGMYPRGTAVKNLVYFMTFGPILVPKTTIYPSKTLFPNAVISGVDISEGAVVIDFNIGNGFSYTMHTNKGIGNISVVYNKLLIGTKNSTVAFPDCSAKLACDYFLPLDYYISDFASTLTKYKSMRYTSPMLIDNSYSTLKEYEKVRIVYTGSFTVSVTLDGSGQVMSRTFTDNDSTDSFIILGIPNSNNKGYGIQFHIEGTGTIKSIQYTWKPRELQ